jgi:esterase/lipase superfamily enzyme
MTNNMPPPKKRRKRILRLLALVASVIVGMGLYAYTIGTRTLLEHAENFSFNRMSVSKIEGSDAFRLFYATNRLAADPQGPVDQRFTSERGSELGFGTFDTRIEPTLGLGIIVNPSDWFLNEEIQLLDVVSRHREEFISGLRKQVDASRDRSLLLVVHGFREEFPSALRKTAFLGHVLDIDTPLVVFDWPGNQGSSLRGYRRARGVSKESGNELAQLIRLISQEIQPDRFWLIANSMGGQVVADAFHLLSRAPDFSQGQGKIENVVLTAPDVDHEEFNNQFKQEILALADNATVYVSSNDRALLISRIINRGLRLGESTLDPSNPGQIEEAMGFSELIEPGSNRLVLVDVTPVNRTRNFHNFSLETPEFFDDLFLRLTGSDLPLTRELYLIRTPDDAKYFVLTRAQ